MVHLRSGTGIEGLDGLKRRAVEGGRLSPAPDRRTRRPQPATAEACEGRVLVLAPIGHDTRTVVAQLAAQDIRTRACHTVAELVGELRVGAGAAIITEETLLTGSTDGLLEHLAQQPPWSDFPFVLLTSGGTSRTSVRLVSSLGPTANVTLLERPVRSFTLVHAVRAALRARRRQYEVRDQRTTLQHEVEVRQSAERAREESFALAERARAEAEASAETIRRVDTTRREVERRAREVVEAATREKDEFLALLSHELRNPLAAMMNAVVIARLDAEQRDRALEIARRQTQHLSRLVDDLLDVARITQGRITLCREPVALAQVVERAVEATRTWMEDRQHHVIVSLPTDAVLVDGDPVRLEQVTTNLLTNAAKYTGPGGHIEVAVAREGDAAVLRVRDDGMGVTPDLMPRIFDLFAQGDRPLDRAQGGLGLGLSIVKRLVELHGGSVMVRSAGPGTGSEFVIRLPVLASMPAERHLPPVATARPGHARVLIVEDNPDASDALLMLLEVLGHKVRVVRDGPAALDAVRATVPDVALVDIGLPGMDGYEVARRVRTLVAPGQTTLIALTGYGREEDRQRALAAGFDYHLTKPVEVDALRMLLETPSRACVGATA